MKRTRAALLNAIWLVATIVPAGATGTTTLAGEVVAVFNFVQRDDDPQYAWLSKGLADLLINQLADLPDITVVSRDRMQMLVSEYDRFRVRIKDDARYSQSPVQLAQFLRATRVVFGTYAVRGGRVTITAQVSDARTEGLLWERKVDGDYSQTLNLQRELARRIRAYFTGRAVDGVALNEVPQWTSHMAAAEHLYAGVGLFDQGEYAEAWLRFRLAGRADPGYPDADYWQARMFYYLTMYENARPLYEWFLKRDPRHPRAGDAVLETVDSARQEIADPNEMLEVYEKAKLYCGNRVMVYNKTMGSQMPLNWYIEGLAIKALMHLERHHEAYRRAVAWDEETSRYRYSEDQVLDPELLRYSVELTDRAAVKLLDRFDEERFLPGLASNSGRFYQFDLGGGSKDRSFHYRYDSRYGARPMVIEEEGKFAVQGRGVGTVFIAAPPGQRMVNLRVTVEHHHESESVALNTTVLVGFRGGDGIGRYTDFHSDEPTKTIKLPTPHRCRFVRLYFWIKPVDLATKLFTNPVHDGLRCVTLTADFEPIRDAPGALRVRVSNASWCQVRIDGHPVDDSVLIRGVEPGPHEIAVRTSSYTGAPGVFEEMTVPVEVEPTGITECDIALPLRAEYNPQGWSSVRNPRFKFPQYKLPPLGLVKRVCIPSLLRPTRGPLQNRLVAVWSYREQIWMAHSYDGQSWSQPEELPVPVNSAHLETAPKILQTEDGRICMAFLSDRGIHRALSPYVCETTDLVHWTAPRRASEVFADDLEICQDSSGRVLLVLPPPYRGHSVGWTTTGIGADGAVIMARKRWEAMAGEKYGRTSTLLLASDDLRNWQLMEHGLGTDQTRRVQILPTADGLLHAFTTAVVLDESHHAEWAVLHQTSSDATSWSRPNVVWQAGWGDFSNLTVTTDGAQFYGSVLRGDDILDYFEVGLQGNITRHSYTAVLGGRNAVYYDPLMRKLHWFSGGEESRYLHTFRNPGCSAASPESPGETP